MGSGTGGRRRVRLWDWLRARIAFDYLAERRSAHLTRYPQLACLAFDHMAMVLNVEGRADAEALDFLHRRLGPRLAGRTVCDVGANIGNHSIAFAAVCGRVVALEPHPAAFALLAFNCRDLDNVTLLNLGASDRAGVVTAVSPAPNLGGTSIQPGARPGPGVAEFAVAPLDEVEALAGADLALLKIDVEGHEDAVLAGAEGLLRRTRPIVLLEQLPEAIRDGTSPAVERLKALGYGHFHSLEAPPDWRTPGTAPPWLRRWLRAVEAVALGPPARTAVAAPVTRLEPRPYPLLLASTGPLDLDGPSGGP